eukprot:g1948.t1
MAAGESGEARGSSRLCMHSNTGVTCQRQALDRPDPKGRLELGQRAPGRLRTKLEGEVTARRETRASAELAP